MKTSVLTGFLLVAVDILVHGNFYVLTRLEYVIVFNASEWFELSRSLTFGFPKFGYVHTFRYCEESDRDQKSHFLRHTQNLLEAARDSSDFLNEIVVPLDQFLKHAQRFLIQVISM